MLAGIDMGRRKPQKRKVGVSHSPYPDKRRMADAQPSRNGVREVVHMLFVCFVACWVLHR